MSAPYQNNTGIADGIVQYQQLLFQAIIKGNVVAANIVPQTDQPGIIAYTEIGVTQPTTGGTGLLFLQDGGANFPVFVNNANPSTFGVLLLVGDAFDPVGNTFPAPVLEALRVPVGVTATISPNGDTTTGVTLSNNLAFSISCAGANFNAANVSFEFLFRLTYKRSINLV